MTKLEQLQNVLAVLARVQEFGPFFEAYDAEELKEYGEEYNSTPEGYHGARQSVALLAHADSGEALGVDELGKVHELTAEQAAGLPKSGEWVRDNAHDFGELKNRKTLEEVGAWWGFEEIKEIPAAYTGARVYPLAYSLGLDGVSGALAVLEEGGRVKLVKVTTRRNVLFELI